MWIITVAILISTLQYAEPSADEVVFTCDSCKNKKSPFNGEVGGNLSFVVTVNNAKFTMLTIKYETSSFYMLPNIIESWKVTDKRLIVPDKPTTGDNKVSAKILLTNLTLDDNLRRFSSRFVNDSGYEFNDEIVIKVNVGPTFYKPLEKEYRIEVANKFHLNFSLVANPEPSEISASFASQSFTVNNIGSDPKKYLYHYRVDGGFLKKELCGSKLKLKAVGLKTITFTSDVKLLFIPDIPQGLTAHRDKETKDLEITWTGLTYGTCLVRYHVRFTNQNKTSFEYRVNSPKYSIKNAIGDISVAVNAEVNDQNGTYGEKVTLSATTALTIPIPDEEAVALEYIIAMVIGAIALILITIIAVCVFRRKRVLRHTNESNDDYAYPDALELVPPLQMDHANTEDEDESYYQISSPDAAINAPLQMDNADTEDVDESYYEISSPDAAIYAPLRMDNADTGLANESIYAVATPIEANYTSLNLANNQARLYAVL